MPVALVACIIQARMGSSRLPGKSLKPLAGKPMLWHVVERCRMAKSVDRVIVATSTNPEDDAIAQFCSEHNIDCFRGSSENVLRRYVGAALEAGASVVVRVTGDCPLIDPATIDACVAAFYVQRADYVSNVEPGPRTFPRGLDVQVVSFSALESSLAGATELHQLEHVTPYITENAEGRFRIGETVCAPPELARSYRLTVDYPEDFFVLERIYEALFDPGAIVNTVHGVAFIDTHPELIAHNASCEQKPIKPT